MDDVFSQFGVGEPSKRPDPRDVSESLGSGAYGRQSVSSVKDWGTPPNFVVSVREVLGPIELDPCSNEWSLVDAHYSYCLPERDGLEWSWEFKSIFCNPPYGRDMARNTTIKDWLRRCAQSHQNHGSEVIALVPVATNTAHWKQYVWPVAAAVCFMAAPRFKFMLNGSRHSKGAPIAIAGVYWGTCPQRFKEVFDPRWGKVVLL